MECDRPPGDRYSATGELIKFSPDTDDVKVGEKGKGKAEAASHASSNGSSFRDNAAAAGAVMLFFLVVYCFNKPETSSMRGSYSSYY